MAIFDSYRIARSAGRCHGCEAEFDPGQTLYSALYEGQGEEELQRHDFCGRCWPDHDRDPYFCHWKTRRPAPDEKKQVLDTDLMLEFFQRLEGAAEENKRAFRFVLALYLMRRKELKLLGVERADDGGAEELVFERRSSGERARVLNPELSQEQIEQAAENLGRLFDADL